MNRIDFSRLPLAMSSPTWFLVWWSGPLGPQAQKWAEMDYGDANWRKSKVLSFRPLAPDEFDLPLKELAVKYPLTL